MRLTIVAIKSKFNTEHSLINQIKITKLNIKRIRINSLVLEKFWFNCGTSLTNSDKNYNVLIRIENTDTEKVRKQHLCHKCFVCVLL